MSNVLFGGLHRGASAIVKELKDETTRLYGPDWLLADPKADRAAQMAGVLRYRFAALNPQPLSMRVQDALPYSRDHDTVVLALDTVADTSATLAARLPSQRVTFQFSGKGPGGAAGTRIAIQGTLCPGDEKSERAVSLLLPTLGEMSRAASSRDLTGPDPLTAAVLQPLRQVASRQTARHLAEKEREPWDMSGGPLSVIFGQTVYPLIAVHGGREEKYSQQAELALESAGGVPGASVITHGLPGCMVVVAVVIPHAQTVHFMRVALQRTGKRSVAGVTTFASPRVTQRSSTNVAVFTD
jgi:hypothetical protein